MPPALAIAIALIAQATPSESARLQVCKRPEVPQGPTRPDAKARESAHKAFTHLAASSIAWTKNHQCFGCHVQAVTMEALTAAQHHQYDVNPKDIQSMADALAKGVTAGGRATGVAFEGAAWAGYDKYVDEKQTQQLIRYADELMQIQANDGAIIDDDRRLPITGGTMQTTYQAAQTWRQAYARTANDRYLAPMRKAERFLTAKSESWKSAQDVYLQDLSFALLGLASAGVTQSEPASRRLQEMILSRRHQDGGWGLEGNTSDAFATGQAIYALKLAGLSDTHPAIASGITYLLGTQSPDGAWRTAKSGQHGSEKGETMWAVLALVTVDVASIAITGLTDGQHVSDVVALDVAALDNQSEGIVELALLVDDIKVAVECGPKLRFGWDTTKLSTGKHVLDVIAVNGKGKQSRRRLEVFAGDVFLTDVGAVFDEGSQQTRVSLRNIADPKHAGQIEVEFWSLDGKSDAPKAKVFVTNVKATPGAAQINWDGLDAKKQALPRGRYLAKVSFKDAKGETRQTESALFLHDSDRIQKEKYGEIEGKLKLNALGIGSSNTFVDLVDKDGKVVQTTRSTEQGNYRFKTVTPGAYKVRARKGGFAAQESPVTAEPNAPAAKADLAW